MKKPPVFIVGLHRTGSTLFKNMLNNNPEICMMPDELHLWSPYPWIVDLDDLCSKVRKIKNEELNNILNLFFSKKLSATFWKNIEEYKLDKDRILKNLRKMNDVTCIDIATAIFEDYKEICGKEMWGAKYPVHIAGIKLLEKWYPKCKIIHLTRDPRGIYISKSNDEASRNRKKKYPYLAFFYDLFLIMFIGIEYSLSAHIHQKYKNKNNYLLVKYEDIMINPEGTMKEICKFLGVRYVPEMIYASGKPSSIDGKIKKGVDRKRAYRWKAVIKPWEKLLIDILTSKARKKLGYGDD